MSGVNDASLAVHALTNRLLDVGVAPLKASEFWKVVDKVEDLADLHGLTVAEMADATAGTGLEAERLVRLLDSGVGLAMRLDDLYEKGIAVITLLDDGYPHRLRERLGTAAPPVLYCAGDLTILAEDGIGMVGSRDVGPDGAEITRKAAHQVAGHGLSLVSGGAKGVDQISMAAAFEAGGNVIGVLADSLERAISRSDNRQALLEGRACLCTPYQPNARFTTGTAMGRNKIIYGLSRATLVIASAKDSGGTWAGATEALKKGYGTVAVWMGAGAGPGNQPLVDLGGTAVDEPEAVVHLSAVEPRVTETATQTTLSFEGTSDRSGPADLKQDEPTEPDDVGTAQTVDSEADAPGAVPSPPGAIVPEPTGICWCGCDKPVAEGVFFLPRHAPGAAQRAVIEHFGSVESFLLMLGEAPGADAGD